jgi:hypothetical protein
MSVSPEGLTAALTLPEAATIALREMVLDDELTDNILKNGQLLEPMNVGAVTSYPILYRHPDQTNEGVTGQDIVLIDVNENGQVAGFGDVSYLEGDPSPYLHNKPFVAYTQNTDVGRGLGMQRARNMNQLSEAHFGNVLNSDPDGFTSNEAHKLWLRLVASGDAEIYDENGSPRYRFKPTLKD